MQRNSVDNTQTIAPSHGLDALPPDAFVRVPEVMRLCGLGRSTIYEQVKLGRFPAPVKLTAHAAGWRAGALRAWLDNPTGWRVDRRVVGATDHGQ